MIKQYLPRALINTINLDMPIGPGIEMLETIMIGKYAA